MSVKSGEVFGPYEILAPIGAGGMGEVYKARDSRLNRDVAIKVLPQNFAADPDRRARFEREAQMIASLSHPNILAIFDTGIHDGHLFIVTELLEGETLRSHLGSLSVRRSIDIGVQIARGLTAAHDKGVVHRDLKPENIFLLPDGHVKILDFGLARQTNTAPGATLVTNAPTAAGVTDPGVAVGTASYMSPEQVRGADVDYRTDIFALGCVLYEMLSGRQAFRRDTAAETMTAILKEEPVELMESGIHITPQLDRIVRRCLEKQPRLRFQSATDLGFALEAVGTPSGSGTAALPLPAVGAARKFPWLAAAMFVFGFGLAVALFAFLVNPAHSDVSAFHFTPFSFESGGQDSPVWSGDGKAVAYSASMDKVSAGQVFVRYLDSPNSKQLTHLKKGGTPIQWSPDGRRIFFLSGQEPGGLWSVAVVGGEPQQVMPFNDKAKFRATTVTIASDSSVAAMFMEDQGQNGIWFSQPIGSPLKKYTPEPFATRSIVNAPKMAFSPDHKQILLFMNSGERGREEAWIMPYPPNPSQPPHMVFQGFPTYDGTPSFSWMPDNRRIVISLRTDPTSANQLFLADTKSGALTALTSQTTSMVSPRVSPDGERVIFSEPSGGLDIVSVTLENATAHSLIATERSDSMPSWAANQPLLAYVSDRSGPMEIWLRAQDGTSRPIVTARDFPAQTTQWFMSPDLSPAADRVLYGRIGHSQNEGSSTLHLWISSVSGGAPVPLTNDTASNEVAGTWSPDGNSAVYIRLQDGKADLMKVAASGQAAPTLLKADLDVVNGSVPTWSPSGNWIEYNDKGENLISLDGQNKRFLGDLHADGCTFSRDGRLLYCLRWDDDHETLFSLDIAGGTQKVIGRLDPDYRPGSYLTPGIRLSLAPDGKSIAYGHYRAAVNNLWLLDGFSPPHSFFHWMR